MATAIAADKSRWTLIIDFTVGVQTQSWSLQGPFSTKPKQTRRRKWPRMCVPL
jgi:hypothetical protein